MSSRLARPALPGTVLFALCAQPLGKPPFSPEAAETPVQLLGSGPLSPSHKKPPTLTPLILPRGTWVLPTPDPGRGGQKVALSAGQCSGMRARAYRGQFHDPPRPHPSGLGPASLMPFLSLLPPAPVGDHQGCKPPFRGHRPGPLEMHCATWGDVTSPASVSPSVSRERSLRALMF